VDSLVSDHNPLLKQIRRAVSRGALTEDGYAVAEGAHLLAEARRAGCEVLAVFANESSAAEFPEARVVSDKTFRELSSTVTPQGVMALVRPPAWTLGQMMTAQALVIVLDGVQDPGNAGAVLRAAEAFGATGAVFLKGTVNPYNPKCLRGSAGSAFRLPLVAAVEPDAFLAAAPSCVFAAMPRAGKRASDVDLTLPCAIVIGSEAHGVGSAIAARATGVRIPTTGVESLNAAVAAGVLLYEARRQRGAT
jgi:TrmH family RNA methyltransferase